MPQAASVTELPDEQAGPCVDFSGPTVFSASEIRDKLQSALLNNTQPHAGTSVLATKIRGLVGADVVAYCAQHVSWDPTKARAILEPNVDRLRGLLGPISHWSVEACRSGKPQIVWLDAEGKTVAVTVAIPHLAGASDSLTVLFREPRKLQGVVSLLETVACHVGRLRCGLPDTSSESGSFLFSLLSKVNSSPGMVAACSLAANEMLDALAADVVFVVLRQRSSYRLRAVAGLAGSHAETDLTRNVETLAEEIVLRNDSGTWSTVDPVGVTETTRNVLMLTSATHLTAAPIRSNDVPWGALVVVHRNRMPSSSAHRVVQEAGQLLGPCLEVRLQADANYWARVWRWLRTASRTKTSAVVAMIATLIVLCLPVPYRLRCPCVVEPATRRVISAPYEGTLEVALVKPGDTVQAGQILAKMDAQEISWELSSLTAELNQAQKQWDVSAAERDTATSQIAKLEMDSLRFRQRTLEQRLANLEIRSPIDGVVIAGDASRHEGSRLTIGEALMEIGALDQMVVELSVDDDEINSVREGQDVRIRLDSHPRSKFKGQLNQLHPMAELRDGDNVFIAEVPLENPTAILRPGMRGHAKVNTGRRLLGWILFHRAWHQLLFRIGW